VFPGGARAGNRLGGTPARPDLHFAREVLLGEGLAVLEVWWDAGRAPDGDLEPWLDAHVEAALAAASEAREVGCLVGRSFGTLAVARALPNRLASVPTIWLAPLFTRPEVVAAVVGAGSSAFVAGGSGDALFAGEGVERARAAGAEVVVVEGADHGLGLDDPAASARALADVLDRMRLFLRRNAGQPA
jgi:pimeloyl-ACP methyl ester carboxylesterase